MRRRLLILIFACYLAFFGRFQAVASGEDGIRLPSVDGHPGALYTGSKGDSGDGTSTQDSGSGSSDDQEDGDSGSGSDDGGGSGSGDGGSDGGSDDGGSDDGGSGGDGGGNPGDGSGDGGSGGSGDGGSGDGGSGDGGSGDGGSGDGGSGGSDDGGSDDGGSGGSDDGGSGDGGSGDGGSGDDGGGHGPGGGDDGSGGNPGDGGGDDGSGDGGGGEHPRPGGGGPGGDGGGRIPAPGGGGTQPGGDGGRLTPPDDRLYYVGSVSTNDGSTIYARDSQLKSSSRWLPILRAGTWFEAYGRWEGSTFIAEEINVLTPTNWAYYRGPVAALGEVAGYESGAVVEAWTRGDTAPKIDTLREAVASGPRQELHLVAFFNGSRLIAAPAALPKPPEGLPTGWVELVGRFDGEEVVWLSFAPFP